MWHVCFLASINPMLVSCRDRRAASNIWFIPLNDYDLTKTATTSSLSGTLAGANKIPLIVVDSQWDQSRWLPPHSSTVIHDPCLFTLQASMVVPKTTVSTPTGETEGDSDHWWQSQVASNVCRSITSSEKKQQTWTMVLHHHDALVLAILCQTIQYSKCADSMLRNHDWQPCLTSGNSQSISVFEVPCLITPVKQTNTCILWGLPLAPGRSQIFWNRDRTQDHCCPDGNVPGGGNMASKQAQTKHPKIGKVRWILECVSKNIPLILGNNQGHEVLNHSLITKWCWP